MSISENRSRKQLEKNLEEKTKVLMRVKYDSNPKHAWIKSDEFQDYLLAWWDLADYYNRHDDTEVSAITMREYVTFATIFRNTILECASQPDLVDEVKEAAEALDTRIEELLRYAVSNFYSRNKQ